MGWYDQCQSQHRILALIDPSAVIDATKRGSGAYRATHLWQNLLFRTEVEEERSSLQVSVEPINEALASTGFEE
jgi:hypothetical protein